MTNQNPPAGGSPRRRPTFRPVEVAQVVQLSPRMRRVTLRGAALEGYSWSGPAAHIKIVFPLPGHDAPTLPEPEGPRPLMRTYTPRRFDAQARELDVEFVLHGDGPAASWAAQARPGQQLLIAGPGPGYAINAEADWYVLAGDETAIPAIATILERLPQGKPASVYLEVVGRHEQRALASPADVTLAWLERGPDVERAGVALEQALRDAPLEPGVGQFYVGCEASAMRRIRAQLLNERGVASQNLVTRGYWKHGASNHPDHDYGTD
jgi:NADPH-dependent ferric siderophore reductase